MPQELHVRYDNVADAVALLDESTPFVNGVNRPLFRSAVSHRPDGGGIYWHGVSGGMDAVRKVIREGWSDGVARMQEKLNRMDAPRTNTIRRKHKRGDHGDEVNMQRVYAGQFDTAFTRMHKQVTHGPRRVRLVVNVGANKNISADALFWRGAAALRLSDTLTEAGYSVEVAAISATRNGEGGEIISLYVTVAKYGEPASLAHLAGCLALAGFHRTIGFASRLKNAPFRIKQSMGHSINPAPYMPVEDNELTVLLNDNISDAESANLEVERVLGLLHPQGER